MWKLLLLLSVVESSRCDILRAQVTTAEGAVLGTSEVSADGRLYHSFKGIPYAGTAQRLQPPRRHEGWSQVLDASKHGQICLQYDTVWTGGALLGSEDCLFANVYTPRLPRSSDENAVLLPVMVWVHGGGFIIGSGNVDLYGPDYLMDEDVVVVTFNYRLGPLGFFTTEDAAAAGNYGLLDQVLLLEWVRDNIAVFGGDPQLVTLFGESAGGASVSLLMLSPLTRGLFHRVISQSGTSLSGFAVGSEGNGLAKMYSDFLNCSSSSSQERATCFLNANSTDIIAAHVKLSPYSNFPIRVDCDREHAFLPQDPHVLLREGHFSHVPLMQGQMAVEAAFFVPTFVGNPKIKPYLDTRNAQAWAGVLGFSPKADALQLDQDIDMLDETRKVLQFYFGDQTVNLTNDISAVANMLSDSFFTNSIIAESRLVSRRAPVYSFLFDYRGPGFLSSLRLVASQDLGVEKVEPVEQLVELGATHGDDVLYLFHPAAFNHSSYANGTATGCIIRAVVDIWTNFAKQGFPSSSRLQLPVWPIFTAETQRYMRINGEPTLQNHVYEDRINFWASVGVNVPWKHPLQRSCMSANSSNPTLEKPECPVA